MIRQNIFYVFISTFFFALIGVCPVKAQYYSVNFDYKTIGAMVGAYAEEAGTEAMVRQNTSDIAESYGYSEVATAGIFASKLLDRNALKSSKGFGNPDENFYYKKAYRLVANKIIPRTISVTKKLIKEPSTSIYWGTHLLRVMADTKSLCNQFSALCSNSSLSFSDIPFVEFTGTLQNIFDLQQVGNFKTLFDDISNIGSNFSEENVDSELDNLRKMAVGLANAGSNDVQNLFSRSAFNGTFLDNVAKISNTVEGCSSLWSSLKSAGETTLNSLKEGNITDLTKILTTSNGSSNGWISSYNTGSEQQYYKQRVYIYHVDSGSEVLCDYVPPTDNDNILYGDHYTRFATDQQNYYMTTAERNQALQNSYNHAGWSQAMVDERNRSNDGYSYSMTTWAHGYSCYRTKNGNFNGYYAYSIAYEVKVTRSWYNKEVFYEDTFDSYSMDWNTFMNVMYAKLQDANRNESGKTYRIGYDTKRYYTATNARKLAGATLATFKSRCESDGKLVDGTVQYKCSSCGGSPSEHTKQCTMATSLNDNPFSYDEINNAISSTESQISQKKSQIDAYNRRNNEILSALTKSNDYEEQNRLRQEYSQNRREIEALQGEYDSLNSQLSELRNAKQQAIDFENSQQDGYDRIPSIIHNLQSNFSLEWLEEDHWDGFTFVRTANMRNLKSTVTFKATVSISRRPKYFLGIKIHRAIVQISWELLAEYNDESVIETMQLDPNSNQEEQTSKVNQRLSELQRIYPDCDVSVDYEYASGQEPEEDDDDDKIHLLWASDRLDACREIVRRLEAIYVDLVVLDKYLHYKYSILDWLKDMTVNRLNSDRGRRLSIAERSRRRWMHNAGSAIFEREEEDDNYEEE